MKETIFIVVWSWQGKLPCHSLYYKILRQGVPAEPTKNDWLVVGFFKRVSLFMQPTCFGQ